MQNTPLVALYHFRASLKAVIAQSLTFELRLIEDWSRWQIWPIVCVHQLCFSDEDLTDIFCSVPAIMKMKEICPYGRFGGFGTDLPIFCGRPSNRARTKTKSVL